MRTLLLFISLGALALSAADSPLAGASVNGAIEADVAPGWPLLVRATLVHPQFSDESADPISIAKDAIRIEVRNAAGEVVSWPFETLPSEAAVVIDGKKSATVRWTLAPEAAAALDRGNYTAVVRIEGADTDSTPVRIKLVSRTDQADSRLLLLNAAYAWWRGDVDGALNATSTLLSQDPDNIGVLELRGDIQAEAGNNYAAYQNYDRAVTLAIRDANAAKEPPQILITKRNAAFTAAARDLPQ